MEVKSVVISVFSVQFIASEVYPSGVIPYLEEHTLMVH